MNEPKLYYDATPLESTPDSATWAELDIIKDLTLNDEIEEQDATTRANGGYKSTDVGLRDNGLDLEIDWLPGNTGFDALRAAYIAKSAIAMAVMDQDITTSGATGVAGNWKVTNFTRNEPLGGRLTGNVTIKAFDYMADYTVAGA